MGAAVASEQQVITIMALDTRPSSGTKLYKVRFNRRTAGTAALDDRRFMLFTLPDPA